MATQPANDWRRTLKRRLAVAAAAFLLWSVAIEARLVYLQVMRHDELSTRAERQQSRTIEAPAKRGELLDRQGRVLAYSVDADTIYAVPTDIEDPAKAASALCGALADCAAKDRQALADRIRRGRAFVYVRRQVSPEQARRVAALDLERRRLHEGEPPVLSEQGAGAPTSSATSASTTTGCTASKPRTTR